MTANDLANKLNLNKGIISKYINNKYKPKADRLHQIATILDVDVAWLMGYDVPIRKDKKWSISELKVKLIELINNSQLNDVDKKKLIEDVEYVCR